LLTDGRAVTVVVLNSRTNEMRCQGNAVFV
jgi:hypothetical protein